MIPAWWSYLLMAFGIAGIWLAGRRNSWGWFIGIVAQALWIVYAVVTRQYGFIISALVYGAFYANNFTKWQAASQTQTAGGGSIR
jgi:nicotinamide riboside transporter PnuC